MIAEHEFITTFEEEEALAAASQVLMQMGFSVKQFNGKLVARRGIEKPHKAIRERQLPQSLELTFDRGRCTLAASVMLQAKPKPIHRDMVKTALTTIERVLVHGMTDDQALEAWRLVDSRANARTAQHSGVRRIILWVLIGFLCLLVFGCIIGIVTSSYP